MMRRGWLAWVAWFVFLPSLAGAEETAPVEAPRKEYRRMPWHLVDLWWDTGKSHPFESLTVDVEIRGEYPEGSLLYIAPNGAARLNGRLCYGGIQTMLDGYTRDDQRLRKLGPGYIFSMWDDRRLEAIRPSAGGFLQSSGHEGDFVSVRRPHAWRPGKYTVRYVKLDPDTVEGEPHRWVGAWMQDHQTNENIFVGALRFQGDQLTLDRKFASFVEIYGPAVPVEKIPRLTVVLGNVRINGQPVEGLRVQAVYPRGVPDVAAAEWADGSVVITLGDEADSRPERSHWLNEG